MRGMETGKTRVRHEVFTEIAKLAYEGGDYARALEELPYKICPGDPDEIGAYRSSLLLERMVVGERLRLAMGLSLRELGVPNSVSDNIEETIVAEKYYEPPLINVIKFACNRCPDNVVKVTNGCQGCFEHPCMEVCPHGAISKREGKAFIDTEKCTRCGTCMTACSFGAIIHQKRPCREACGMKCIGSDEHGRARIDYDKCTSCGQCLVNCPFGAISDKSQIFQTIMAIKSEAPVYAAVAPSFVGQFGKDCTPEMLYACLRRLGFEDVYEVAAGADLCVMQEAEDFLNEVPAKHSFMVTSCCPSWSDMVKKLFPEMQDNISVALTPMVLTARLIKRRHPGCKVAFIGPCDSKKLEASRHHIRSEVDFVLTFEELLGMFSARSVDIEHIPESELHPLRQAGTDARNFAVSGGVAQAVVNAIRVMDPTREVKIARAAGLSECRKLLLKAKAGKYDGYLLEGMACPGGCIAGAGTLKPVNESLRNVAEFAATAPYTCALDTEYKAYLPLVSQWPNE